MEHTHEHNHDHKHEDGCGCGCGGHEAGGEHNHFQLTEEEDAFLLLMAKSPCLPVAQFALYSSKSSHFSSVALAPVFLTAADLPMEMVRENVALVGGLVKKGLIDLDYDEAIEGEEYEIYQNSVAFQWFSKTVEEAKGHADFVYDIGKMECGRMTLTDFGRHIAESLIEAML